MKILYVTGMCDPIKDILTGKRENEITHAAQFFHPWHKLVQRGHQVDFILASNFNDEPRIAVDWFRKENIYANVYDPASEAPWYRRTFRRLKRLAKLLYYTHKALRENKYDFVYCKAFYEGLAGNIVANLHGVPCGVRSMGTMLFEDFKKHGPLGTAWRRPAEFLTFKLRKEFFLMTDDGTKGDLVYQQWKPRRRKYEYLFWRTGIEMKTIGQTRRTRELPAHPYIFFAARFDRWKRHDRILRILKVLHASGSPLHLYFAGVTQSDLYHAEMVALVSELGLVDYVHFLGAVPQDDVKAFAYHAVANPLLYDVSNLGNVFFEIFSVGAIVLGKNDGSLDEYLVDQENGFVIDGEEQAAGVIRMLLEEPHRADAIRANAIACARSKFMSADERFDMEVDLIESAVATGKPAQVGAVA